MTSVLSELTGMVTNGPTMPSLIENFVAAAKNPSKEYLVGFDGQFKALCAGYCKMAVDTVWLQVTGLCYYGGTPGCKVLVMGNVMGNVMGDLVVNKSRIALCRVVVEYDLATRTGVICKV